jgi:hypothetical protein
VLGTHVLDRRCAIAPTDRLAVRAAFLIEPTRFDACRQAIAEVRERRPDLRILVSGPWAPYSFVSRDRADERSPLGQALNDIGRCLIPPSTGGRTESGPAALARTARASVPI